MDLDVSVFEAIAVSEGVTLTRVYNVSVSDVVTLSENIAFAYRIYIDTRAGFGPTAPVSFLSGTFGTRASLDKKGPWSTAVGRVGSRAAGTAPTAGLVAGMDVTGGERMSLNKKSSFGRLTARGGAFATGKGPTASIVAKCYSPYISMAGVAPVAELLAGSYTAYLSLNKRAPFFSIAGILAVVPLGSLASTAPASYLSSGEGSEAVVGVLSALAPTAKAKYNYMTLYCSDMELDATSPVWKIEKAVLRENERFDTLILQYTR
jgi:hypothetical protein